MPVPSQYDLTLPILKLSAEGYETIPQCMPALIEMFNLTPEEAEEVIPSGSQTKLANRAHWARNHLRGAGLVESYKRGHARITDGGRRLLASSPERLDREFLNRLEEKIARQSPISGQQDLEPKQDSQTEGLNLVPFRASSPAIIESTPDEIIANAHAELLEATAAELLTLTQSMDPIRFEGLIVDLLLAMGYGGGDHAMGRRLGRSGDGGIDGVIDEDALGLDAVYIQAKRYGAGNTVGRPAIQQFVGSLQGEGATKGVFVTTSAFSSEARAYAMRIPQRVILIDGPRLARLMIQHDVGVRTRQVYAVKTVDEDYFADPDA